jgi:hypothetical protein
MKFFFLNSVGNFCINMVTVVCCMNATWRLSEWIPSNLFQSRHLRYFWKQYPIDDRPLLSNGYLSCFIPLRPWFRILFRRPPTLIQTYLLLSFYVSESYVKDSKIGYIRKLSTALREHVGCGGIHTGSVMNFYRRKLTWILSFRLRLSPSMDEMIFMQRLRLKKSCTFW